MPLVLALFLYFTVTHAQVVSSCAPVDLRSEMLARGLPDRRHQDTTGWCYSFVAADLVSFKVRANVSASDIALSYINTDNSNFMRSAILDENGRTIPGNTTLPLGGGFASWALDAAIPRGFCREEEFPSEDRVFAEQWARSREERQGSPGNKDEQSALCLELDRVAPLFSERARPFLEFVDDGEFISLLNRLGTSRCRERLRPQIRQVSYFYPENVYENDALRPVQHPIIQGKIEEQLSAGNIIGMSYDSGVLTSVRDSSTDSNPLSGRNSFSSDHAALIVGRRLNPRTNVCEYLVRNSDDSCAQYTESLRSQCENNHVWVPREQLVPAIDGVTHVE